MNLEQLKKYIRYSNIYITVGVNPLHWAWYWLPKVTRYRDSEWPVGPNEREYRLIWLGLLVKVMLDDGSW